MKTFPANAKIIVFGILWLYFSSSASLSLDGPQTYGELIDMLALGGSDRVGCIQIVNGSPKINVRFTVSEKSVEFVVPEGQKLDLLTRCLRSNVQLDVRDSSFDLPFLPASHQEPLTFSQLENFLKSGKATAIQKVYVPPVGSTLGVQMVGSVRERAVVCNAELKLQFVADLKKNGVMVEERAPEKPDFFCIELAFFLAVVVLGTIFASSSQRRKT